MGRKLDFAIIGLLVVAVVFLVMDNYVLNEEPTSIVEGISDQPTVEKPVETASVTIEQANKEVLPNSVAGAAV